MKGSLAGMFVAFGVVLAGAAGRAQGPPPTDAAVLDRASAYVREYERRFSLLVAEERYVQEIRRPEGAVMGGGNLSRTNPGGGFNGGPSVRKRQTVRSDYLLVSLGAGGGWMPFRDTFEVDGRTLADRHDRLAKLFLEPSGSSLEQATRIMADSTRYNLGSMQRTVNIPTLALMFLHPDIRPRFTFSRAGDEVIAGRPAWSFEFSERQRPTLIKTSRGHDLPATGTIWIDPATGTILKTSLTAADPIVRALVTTTYRDDADVAFWIPDRMEDYYKAARDIDEVSGLATYTNYRKFSVNTDEALRKPPPE